MAIIKAAMQVGKKIWWPVLGLMRHTLHGRDVYSTLRHMDEKGAVQNAATNLPLDKEGVQDSKKPKPFLVIRSNRLPVSEIAYVCDKLHDGSTFPFIDEDITPLWRLLLIIILCKSSRG